MWPHHPLSRQPLGLLCPHLKRFASSNASHYGLSLTIPDPIFARALSLMLMFIFVDNSDEAWLKHFMLPKCVLPSLRSKGRHSKHIPIKILCDLWTRKTLWNLAVTYTQKVPSQQKQQNLRNQYDSVISLAKLGRYGNACRIPVSDGFAPLNNAT